MCLFSTIYLILVFVLVCNGRVIDTVLIKSLSDGTPQSGRQRETKENERKVLSNLKDNASQAINKDVSNDMKDVADASAGHVRSTDTNKRSNLLGNIQQFNAESILDSNIATPTTTSTADVKLTSTPASPESPMVTSTPATATPQVPTPNPLCLLLKRSGLPLPPTCQTNITMWN